ncbi:MAG TPA: S9 family peptidase [Pyrinomonadaceae bacterium]|jgi:dipeptidyl aminopeptidase/acylaminoacyl peptidase|nr:S9 family peptidase [Pyrinomonadaceae bacterium]
MKRLVTSAVVVLLAVASALAQPTPARRLTVNELLKVRRVSDPQVSPDGKWIAFTIADPDMVANKSITQIYLVAVEGGEPRALTSGGVSSESPRWSPDGKRLAFISARDGEAQVWTIDVASGETKKLTGVATGADGPVWSPDGKWLAFTSEVYPQCTTDECNRKRAQAADESKVKAKVADRLLFRHWKTWKEGKRSHIFVVSTDGTGAGARDLTPGDYDAPPFSLGGPPEYAFSPDSKELAFTRNTEKDEAISTNGDIFTVAVAGGEARRITGENRGADSAPLYSPDGRYIAYRSQARAGFEADRWQLMLYDRQTNKARALLDPFDLHVEGYVFSPDSKKIYMVAGERGLQPIYAVAVAGGAAAKLVSEGFNDDLRITPDGKWLVFTRSSAVRPNEVYRVQTDGGSAGGGAGAAAVAVTKINEAFIAGFGLQPAEEVSWTGAEDARVSGWIVKPPDFNPSRKWPLLVLIHGGPQSASNNNWGYRWNPQVFAAAGYVVFMPNPRGSVGYGQKFIDEISGDWGGKVFTDIMNGVAHVLALGYVDKERMGAAGGSYGGYMVNWIEGHNNDPRFQFKALASHAGVFNLTSMYGATEELWFTEWEFKGTPWDNPEIYTRWSPHMFVKEFRTPMLVIHGELDYRVPVGEGLQLFTALQRRGVESRLLYFPDEGHWILKPQNSELWYKTVLGWFDSHLKPKEQLATTKGGGRQP